MNLFLQTIKEHLRENHPGWVSRIFYHGTILIELITNNDEYHILISPHNNELILYHMRANNIIKNTYGMAKHTETTTQYTETTLLQQINKIILAL